MNDEDEMAAMAEMDAIITKRETNMLGYAPKQTDFDDPVVAESTSKRKKKVLKNKDVNYEGFDMNTPEFAVKNVWPQVSRSAKFLQYMPTDEIDEKRFPDR